MSIKWPEVTDRIRAMTRANTPGELSDIANRIGVAEFVLQQSLSGSSRLATIRVIAALVRRGIDAKWMLTGEVDPSLHKRMLETSEHHVEAMVKNLVGQLAREPQSGLTPPELM